AKTNEAKALMDKAMDLLMVSDYAQAQDLAYQAFEIAPNIGEDTYYLSLAGEVMGMPPEDAIVTLREGRPDYEVGKGKRKSKDKGKGNRQPELTWKAFLLDSVILFGVAIATNLLLNQFIQELGVSQDFLSILSDSFGSILSIWVQFIMVHLAATGYLEGDGSFITLFRHARIPLVLQSLVFVVATNYLLAAVPEILANPDATSESALTVILVFAGIVAVTYLVYLIWISVVIAKTYSFNVVK